MQENKFIYDKRDADNKNQNKIQNAWDSLARSIGGRITGEFTRNILVTTVSVCCVHCIWDNAFSMALGDLTTISTSIPPRLLLTEAGIFRH